MKLSSTQVLVSTRASSVMQWLTHFRQVLPGARLQVRRCMWPVPYMPRINASIHINLHTYHMYVYQLFKLHIHAVLMVLDFPIVGCNGRKVSLASYALTYCCE